MTEVTLAAIPARAGIVLFIGMVVLCRGNIVSALFKKERAAGIAKKMQKLREMT